MPRFLRMARGNRCMLTASRHLLSSGHAHFDLQPLPAALVKPAYPAWDQTLEPVARAAQPWLRLGMRARATQICAPKAIPLGGLRRKFLPERCQWVYLKQGSHVQFRRRPRLHLVASEVCGHC
mmetsp:Transcript_33325/g.72771  ORF Transcript_33325/g.72771 Transcript_33325/m.72771 type:complete len:123 (+) Transcript_33325:124-492(+)